MRKEWNIETVNITPTAPKSQEEKQAENTAHFAMCVFFFLPVRNAGF